MKPLAFHDDYEVALNNPTIELDNKYSLGKGTSILVKKGSMIEMIFSAWNNDRRTIAICTYDNDQKMIIGSFHLDVKEKKSELEKLSLFLETLARIYQETDLCLYTDLNIHPEDKLFKEFEQRL